MPVPRVVSIVTPVKMVESYIALTLRTEPDILAIGQPVRICAIVSCHKHARSGNRFWVRRARSSHSWHLIKSLQVQYFTGEAQIQTQPATVLCNMKRLKSMRHDSHAFPLLLSWAPTRSGAYVLPSHGTKGSLPRGKQSKPREKTRLWASTVKFHGRRLALRNSII